MILVTSIEKPCIRTGKGKVIRRLMSDLYTEKVRGSITSAALLLLSFPSTASKAQFKSVPYQQSWTI